MSCIANFKTETFSGTRPSGSYYNITNLTGQVSGNVLYESSLSSSFKDFAGFDWTQNRRHGNTMLNSLGEPKANYILDYSGISRSPNVKHGMDQIESLFNEGYLGVSFASEFPLRMKVNQIHLNPRFRNVSAEVFNTGVGYWLKARTNPTKPKGEIDSDFLRVARYIPQVRAIVDKYGESDLNQVLDQLETMDLTFAQRQILGRFRELSQNNPAVKLVMFDDVTDLDEYQRSFYDPNSNTIFIAKDFRTKQSEEKFIRDILHELAHVYTLGALNNPRTFPEVEFRDRITAIYENILDTFPLLPDAYGFTNVEEFVAEFLSNPYFRLTLEELEGKTKKKKNWFQSLLNEILKFLSSVFSKTSEKYPENQQAKIISEVEAVIGEYLDYIGGNLDIPVVEGESYIRFASSHLDEKARKILNERVVGIKKNTFTWSNLALRLVDPTNQNIATLKDDMNALSQTGTVEEVFDRFGKYLQGIAQYAQNIESKGFIAKYVSTFSKLDPNKALEDLDLVKRGFLGVSSQIAYIIRTIREVKGIGQAEQDFIAGLGDTLFGTVSTPGIFYFVPEIENSTTYKEKLETTLKYLAKLQKQFDSFEEQLTKDTTQISFTVLVNSMSDTRLQEVQEGIQLEIDRLEYYRAKHKIESNYEKQLNDRIRHLEEIKDATSTKEKLVDYLVEQVQIKGIVSSYTFFDSMTNSLQDGSYIAQLVKNYIDNHLLDSTNLKLELTAQIKEAQQKLAAYRKKTNFLTTLKGQNYTESYFKDVLREQEVLYLDEETGKITPFKQMVLNTKVNYVKFNNEYLLKQADVINAKRAEEKIRIETPTDVPAIEAAQAEIKLAEEALETFLQQNAETQYTDDYYAIENILDRDDIGKKARAKLDPLRDELDFAISLLQMEGVEDSFDQQINDLRLDYQRKIRELRNPYNLDGTRKSDEDVEIALRLQEYYAARNKGQVTQAIMTDANKARFNSELSRLKENVRVANNALAAAFTPANQRRKDAAQKELQTWLDQNTRRVISPDYYNIVLAPIFENIRLLIGNDSVSEIYAEISAITAGKKDEDGAIIGHLFTSEEIARIKELEEAIQEIKDDPANKLDKATAKAVADQLEMLSRVRQLQNTSYYRIALAENRERVKAAVLQTKEAEINQIARAAARFLHASQGGITLSPQEQEEGAKFFKMLISVEEYESDPGTFLAKTESQIAEIFANALLERMTMEAQVEDKWFKENHIIDKQVESREENFDVLSDFKEGIVTLYRFSPTRIWTEFIPTDTRYINYEAPNSKWYNYAVNPAYMNPNFTFSRPTPKAALYQNASFPSNPELADVIESFQTVFDNINRRLPMSHKVHDYLVPTQNKGIKEILNSAVDFKPSFFKGLYSLLRGVKDELYEDPDYIKEEVPAKKKEIRMRTARIRFKEPMKSSVQSHDLVDMLYKFMDHAVNTEAMIKAKPAMVSALESVELQNPSDRNSIERIQFDIYRNFLGSVPEQASDQSILLGNPIAQIILRMFRKLMGHTQRLLLKFNYVRAVKNYVSQTVKSLVQAQKYGVDDKTFVKSMIKMWTMYRTYMNIQKGSPEINKKAAIYLMLNAVPTADSGHQASLGKMTWRKKYFSIDSISDHTTNASEFLSGGIIAESLLSLSYIEMNGQQVKLEDAFEFDGKRLTFKNGVNGYDKDAIEAAQIRLQNAKIQYIRNTGISANPTGIDLVQMNQHLAPLQNDLDTITKREEAKLVGAWEQVRDLRNKIHNYFSDTVGQYHGRSYTRAKNNVLFAAVLMLKDRWVIPHIQNYYGKSKSVLYSGTYHHSAFRYHTRNVKERFMVAANGNISGAFEGLFKKNPGRSPMAKYIMRETPIIMAVRLLNYYISYLVINALWGLGGGDDDNPWTKWALGLVGVIVNGIDDEVTTITNPVVKAADIYVNTFKYKPYIISNESDPFLAGLKVLVYSSVDNTARSLMSTADAFLMIPKTLENPWAPYKEYTKFGEKIGILPKTTTKTVFKDKPNLVVNVLKISGGGATETLVDPQRNLEMIYRYSSKSALGYDLLLPEMKARPFVEFYYHEREASVAANKIQVYLLNKLGTSDRSINTDNEARKLAYNIGKDDAQWNQLVDDYIYNQSAADKIKIAYPRIAESEKERTQAAQLGKANTDIIKGAANESSDFLKSKLLVDLAKLENPDIELMGIKLDWITILNDAFNGRRQRQKK